VTVVPIAPRDFRPTKEQQQAAYGNIIGDTVGPDLSVLFVGINPSLWSGATGWHFGRPGNRFWPALHRSGFTRQKLHPSQGEELLTYGLGITNLVQRASARADELNPAELVIGGQRLERLVRKHSPRRVAVVGITAFRIAYDRPHATVGPQDEQLAGAHLWVLPNPSGLNAHYTVDTLAEEFARLRVAADLPVDG